MDRQTASQWDQTPLGQALDRLALLQEAQGRAMVEIAHAQQEDRAALRELLHADRSVLQQLLERSTRPASQESPGALPRVTPQKMAEGDDPEAFLDVFERLATSGGWPRSEWAVRLLPLLSGEALTAAHCLPSSSQLDYDCLRKAITDRMGLTPEEHRRRFRRLRLEDGGRPFSLSKQLLYEARRWLQPEGRDIDGVIEQVVLEQFIQTLPAATSAWVQCHQPSGLQSAVALAENHFALDPRSRGATALITLAPQSQRGIPAGPPKPPHTYTPSPTPRPRSRFNPLSPSSRQAPISVPVAPPQREPQTSGQECWRCGRPGHFRNECPLMEVGQVIRVVGPPASSPDPEGTYRVPVRIQGGRNQALMDSGCMQTMIHQSLVRPGALVEARWVEVRCVHGDIHTYPLVTIEIRHAGKKHSLKAAVSSRLTPLNSGNRLAGVLGIVERRKGGAFTTVKIMCVLRCVGW